MARPKKARVICSSPRHQQFVPVGHKSPDPVRLEHDEYEVLRLHDLEHLTQTEVANQMLVSRPTVTLLLNSAHEKIADALVNGRAIVIDGGNCSVCEIGCACPTEKADDCPKRHRCAASCRYAKQSKSQEPN